MVALARELGAAKTLCDVVIKTQDNYCGQIPKAAINFATKKGLPCFFKGLEKAAVQLMVNEGKMTVVEQAKEL